jgi:cysteine desulfurase/selenocysteine lyase
MSSEIDWEKLRDDFPVTGRVAYLDSAAAGPLPRQVMEAGTHLYRLMMDEGDAGWDQWLERREAIRKRLAFFINAEPDEIAFTTNTSSGMNIISDALEGRGEVISCELEFPVSTITWMHRGVTVHFVKARGGEVLVEDLTRAMNERTGVISLSHVQYSNGFRADLSEIGRSKGRHALVVNASQSAGVMQIDVKAMKIDALCATGHKWMLAGYGSGFVYLSRELLDQSRARAIGWLSVEEPYAMSNREFCVRDDAASRAELGCPHFAGIFALGASVDYLLEIGPAGIADRALALNRELTNRLAGAGWTVLSPLRDESMRSAETLLALDDPASVAAHLAQRGIAITQKPQGIRIATHFFNNQEEIERLLAALDETRRAGL